MRRSGFAACLSGKMKMIEGLISSALTSISSKSM